jgi:hypothetical protein
MIQLKLYMLLLGCRPAGRYTEQHDIFFGIGASLKELVPAIKESWPEVKGNIHIDAWREVNYVDGYEVSVIPKSNLLSTNGLSLFFINLGGYKQGEFEEYHYKVLTVAKDLEEATIAAKKTAFYKHVGIKGAPSHIDEEYGVDADDIHNVEEILSDECKSKYSIQIKPSDSKKEDDNHLGYLPIFRI